MLSTFIEITFDVLHAATGNRYADGDDIRFVNLGPIVLFSNYILTTTSGKHLEEISHAHIVSLMSKLLTSSRGSDDLSIGFDQSRDRRQKELANIKNNKGKYHLRIHLTDVFCFAEYQEIGIYGLGYKLTLTKNTANSVVNKYNAINNAKIKFIAIEWYVPHYTVSLEECNKLMSQIVKKTPTDLNYPARSVFMKEVNTHNFWTFELGVQEGINVLIWIYVVFQQSDKQHDQNLNNDTFYITPVTTAQVVIGTEKYPDSGVLLNYNDDDYSQGYGQIKEAFRAITKDNILQPYVGWRWF